MNYAPICLFLYNRIDHAKLTLDALCKNSLCKESALFVFIDGSKDLKDCKVQDDLEALCFEYESNFLSLSVKRSRENLGLALSLSSGIDSILKRYNRTIVLEDDLVTSEFFLKYMNKCLDLYENSSNVFSVNAYMFPLNNNENKTFLSSLGTSSWGWGTWSDKWKFFKIDHTRYEKSSDDDEFKNKFNFGSIDYYSMLKNKKSWAIHWYYSVFERGGVGVFPTRSLVQNIGFDGSGTNCNKEELYSVDVESSLPDVKYEELVNIQLEDKMKDYLRSQYIRKSLLNRVFRKLKNFL